ncbi:nucleotidyltransferase [Anaerosporobacter sp.]|uniref:nucleotidyltransferase n=1 Tax=Anaerosporobacter sp. TaxID=1872529 RepID=UPI00286F2045|nr:nucleotidyltransferase [Anaerosporobacter sp.]
MHIVGLITEYNPFHNGHAYHIQKAKEITNADYIIVVMSGNYVQRGTPAITDKYSRTQMALVNGADIVFELPVVYATASAETFAMGAVRILHDLGIVDSICFGSECGDLTFLSAIAKTLCLESNEFKQTLQSYLRQGFSYPIARKQALLNSSELSCYTKKQINEVLESSNNILGIEYLKALYRLSSNITPYTILREGSGYHDLTLDTTFSSASALRRCLQSQNKNEALEKHMPSSAYNVLASVLEKTAPIFEDDFSDVLLYQLYSCPPDTLAEYLDMNEDLANRLTELVLKHHNFSDLASSLKSKQYTLTRMNRALLHILLQITTSLCNDADPSITSMYARLLGFQKEASSLLKQARIYGAIPIITKVADAEKLLDTKQYTIFKKDLFATHLYNQIVATKFGNIIPNEYKQGPIRL